jgi:hypothetical protein
MIRFAPLLLLVACAEPAPTETFETFEQAAWVLGFTRTHVSADIYHYEAVLPVGDAPNAALRIHRVVREAAPFVPRKTKSGVMAVHGDFSTFGTNFMPGLAPYLASRNVDVWGLDRRWTLPGATDDVSDFGTMGVAQEIDDLRAALAIARGFRGGDRLALMGFSHGGQLAYTYAAVEGARPAPQRHVDALVPLDYYGALGPDLEDMRVATCDFAQQEYDAVAAGVTDVPNDFFITLGQLALTAPDDVSPFFDPMTNREAMLLALGQTYLFAPFAPFYHLASPILDGDTAIAFRESTETAMATWIANATPHQALLETADFDRLLCGEGVMPVDAPLSNIRVPLYYLGAAGGIGDLGLYATTQVSSTDVTTRIIQRFGPERRAEDFGHTDLLLATDAPALVWAPLATWLVHH